LGPKAVNTCLAERRTGDVRRDQNAVRLEKEGKTTKGAKKGKRKEVWEKRPSVERLTHDGKGDSPVYTIREK